MNKDTVTGAKFTCADCGTVAHTSSYGEKNPPLPGGWVQRVRGLFYVSLCPQCARGGKAATAKATFAYNDAGLEITKGGTVVDLDFDEMCSATTLFLEGFCAVCFSGVPDGHRLCPQCAAEEAGKW